MVWSSNNDYIIYTIRLNSLNVVKSNWRWWRLEHRGFVLSGVMTMRMVAQSLYIAIFAHLSL